jgi:transcriptional regulator with XRE-family HTH domain
VAEQRATLTPTRVEMPPPFGPWLRAQRERSGLSQAEVAVLLKASVQSVIGWEKERRYPRRDVEELYRRRIAAAADEAVRIELSLIAMLDAIPDERTRAVLARRFRVGALEAEEWAEAGRSEPGNGMLSPPESEPMDEQVIDRHHAEVPGSAPRADVNVSEADLTRETMLGWLSTQRTLLAPYQGEWVAFVGHDIVAHAPSFLEVMRAVESLGINDPFLVPVMPDEPFIG